MTLFPLLCLILAEFYKNVQTKVMADRCCQHKEAALVKLKQQQAKVLWIVLAINLAMFAVEFGSGLRAAALSLTGDSLDMLGDALVYGTSLYVIYRSTKAQAGAVLLKGVIMLGFSIAVCARAVYQFLIGTNLHGRIYRGLGLAGAGGKTDLFIAAHSPSLRQLEYGFCLTLLSQ
ncbi:MAG: hypothetical protein AAF722_20675 [Cyanobacteria bacterium P01_C01_bin.70]